MRYLFADCLLDIAAHRFFRSGEEVHVEPQVFDLLAMLAARAGTLVEKEELVAHVWDGLAVSDSTIAARINAARRAVGDDGTAQAVIQTVPRRGFRMKADVTVEGSHAPQAPPPRQVLRYTKSADGSGLAWAESGEGPPLLRVGHWLSHLEMDWHSGIWRPWLERLGNGRRLIRYDQRGTGLSDRTADIGGAGDALEQFSDDMAAVADAAGLDRFAIFAASGAVPVALTFAARHPARVRALILYGGTAQGRALRPTPEGELASEASLALIRAGWGREGTPFAHAFSSFFMPGASAEQITEFMQIQLASASAETAVKLRSVTDHFDVQDLLGRIAVPTLVMHCRRDAVLSFDAALGLVSAIPGARLLPLDGRDHVVLPETPTFGQMMDEVDAFLAEHPK